MNLFGSSKSINSFFKLGKFPNSNYLAVCLKRYTNSKNLLATHKDSTIIFSYRLRHRVRCVCFAQYILGQLAQKLESFTTSKTDRHLLCQNVRQKISVIKTNTFDDIKKIVHFGILIHILS